MAYTHHVLTNNERMDLGSRMSQRLWTNLILAEKRIANTSQNHHRHQKRDHQFVRHLGRRKAADSFEAGEIKKVTSLRVQQN